MVKSSPFRPGTLMTVVAALLAAIVGMQATAGSGTRDGAGFHRRGGTDAAAWTGDERVALTEAALPAEPTEPDDRETDIVALSPGLSIPEARPVGRTRASVRRGRGSHDIGALLARGPPASHA